MRREPRSSRSRSSRFAAGAGIALRILLGASLLSYIVIHWSGEFSSERISAVAWVLPFVVLFGLFGTVIESLRLGLLCFAQRAHLGFLRGCKLVTVGIFFNFCVPGGTGGDVVKLYYLAADNPGRGVELGAVLIVDRVCSLLSLLALVFILGVMNFATILTNGVLQSLLAVCVILFVTLVGAPFVFWARAPYRDRPEVTSGGQARLVNYFKRFVEALSAFRGHKGALSSAVLLSLMGHLSLCAIFALLGRTLFPDLPISQVCFLALLGMLANALPLTPGGLGVGEAAFEGLFRLVNSPGASMMLVVWRVGLLPFALLGGLLYMKGLRRAEVSLDLERPLRGTSGTEIADSKG